MKLVLEKTTTDMLLMKPLVMPEFEATLLPETNRTEDGAMKGRPLIVIQNDCLGHVAPPAGSQLLASLLEQFVSLESLPSAVILQGVGIRLAEPANPAHDTLMRLISLKVPVLICEASCKVLCADCQLAGSRLATQREIAQHLISSPSIIWL